MLFFNGDCLEAIKQIDEHSEGFGKKKREQLMRESKKDALKKLAHTGPLGKVLNPDVDEGKNDFPGLTGLN